MESIPDKETPTLVVDDDTIFLSNIKAAFVLLGMPEPALVSDGRLVIDLLRRHKFQVVLLDLLMPGIGGMNILQRLKLGNPAAGRSVAQRCRKIFLRHFRSRQPLC